MINNAFQTVFSAGAPTRAAVAAATSTRYVECIACDDDKKVFFIFVF